ncbi:hypothetical protein ACN47E_005555 [Coniothyrium glycines]
MSFVPEIWDSSPANKTTKQADMEKISAQMPAIDQVDYQGDQPYRATVSRTDMREPRTPTRLDVSRDAQTTPTAPLSPYWEPPPPHAAHQRALLHGVRQSDVEIGTTIRDGMLLWVDHHEATAGAHFLLDPPPDELQRIRRANASATSIQAHTMTVEHAKEPDIPVGIDVQTMLNKVHALRYEFGYSNGDAELLTPVDREVARLRARGLDVFLYVPEASGVWEEEDGGMKW